MWSCIRLELVLMTLLAIMSYKEVSGYMQLQSVIPNGAKVPDPCNTTNIWPGVGHLRPMGKKYRNQFGHDLAKAGLKWTVELCMMDSDLDGRTNGEELGDPDCQWSVANPILPEATGLITHPGVCEPILSEHCQDYCFIYDYFGNKVKVTTQRDWLSDFCPDLFQRRNDTTCEVSSNSSSNGIANDNPPDNASNDTANENTSDTSSNGTTNETSPNNSSNGTVNENSSDNTSNNTAIENPSDNTSNNTANENLSNNSPDGTANASSSNASDDAAVSNVLTSTQEEFSPDSPCQNPGEEVLHVDYVLPKTKVSSDVASFQCLLVEFPDVTEDYYIIGYDAIIDNVRVVVKVALFNGDNEKDMSVGVPKTCSGYQNFDILALWVFRMGRTCLPPATAIPAGRTGYQRFVLQIQYYKRMLSTEQMDGSGIRLFYTKSKRGRNTAVLTLGQNTINIPGQTKNVEATMECSSSCTKRLFNDTGIHLVSGRVQTHALGTAIELSQYRDGKLVQEILKNDVFNVFGGQGEIKFDPDLFIQSGDTLRLKCVYDSTGKSEMTTFGLDLGHEVCIADLRYYSSEGQEPKAIACSAWDDVLKCSSDGAKIARPHLTNVDNDCNLATQINRFAIGRNFKRSPLCKSIKKACKDTHECATDCLNAILEFRSRDPCLSNEDVFSDIRSKLRLHHPGRSFLKAYDSCKDKL